MSSDEELVDLNEESHPIADVRKQYCGRTSFAIMAMLLTMSLVTIAGLAIGISVLASESNGGDCVTPDCVELAGSVLQKMNNSIDPCVDFYNYSCGGWIANNFLAEGSGRYDIFNELAENNYLNLRELLEGNAEDEIVAVHYMRQLYQSCLDLDALTRKGAQPLLDLVNYTGGWELIGVVNSTAPPWNINSDDSRMSKLYGNQAFFSLSVSPDNLNSSNHITKISGSGLSMNSDSYESDEFVAALEQYIASTLILLNPSGNEQDLKQAAKDIADFEKSLNKISDSASYQLYNLTQLDLHSTGIWTQFDWTEYVTQAFKWASVSVTSDLIVVVWTVNYFQNLTDLFSETQSLILENYFKWHLVSRYIPFLGSDFLQVYYDFTETIAGYGEGDRDITCVQYVEQVSSMPLARLFTDYILPVGNKGNISVMISAIKDAFVERLKENTWIDDTSRQSSIWKVGNISRMIAYPDQIYDDNYLLEQSEALKITQGKDFFKMFQVYFITSSRNNLADLPKPVDKMQWAFPPTEVNAYYSPLFNQFVFLEGILRSPFLVAAWPDYFKLGAIGYVIGHELTHGFDNTGQQYNQYGVYTQWWTEQSVKAFQQHETCFVDQYSQYSMFGYTLDGQQTLGENIADNGGLKTAYQAYQKVAETNSQPTLPAINLTPDQLFFVAFAQSLCGIFTPAYIAHSLETDSHSPDPLRVIGTLSNSEEFSTAFNCPSSSPMNPDKKCDLW